MIGWLVRRLLVLAPLAAIGAWLAEQYLRDRAAGEPPEPIRTVVAVESPIEAAWAVLADVEGQPAWMHDLKDVRLLTPGPIGPGTVAIGRVRILGIAVDDPVTIAAFEPPHRFAISHDGTFRGHGEITLETHGTGVTTITWEETLVAPALPHLFARLARPVLASVFRADLERLASLVEERHHRSDST